MGWVHGVSRVSGFEELGFTDSRISENQIRPRKLRSLKASDTSRFGRLSFYKHLFREKDCGENSRSGTGRLFSFKLLCKGMQIDERACGAMKRVQNQLDFFTCLPIYKVMKNPIPLEQTLQRSLDATIKLPIKALLKQYFPDLLRIRVAEEWEDRRGTDVFGDRSSDTIKVDLKLLSRDPRLAGKDVIPIELYSVKEVGKKGYEGDSDYILWVYVDTLRTVLVRREELVDFIEARREEWEIFLEMREQVSALRTGYVYTSIHCNVPYEVVRKVEVRAVAA